MYYDKLNHAMRWANVEENVEKTMNRFLNGLNDDIVEIFEHHSYECIVDILERAVWTQGRLKRRGFERSIWHNLHGDIVERPTWSYEAITKRTNQYDPYGVLSRRSIEDIDRRSDVDTNGTTPMQMKEVNCTYLHFNNCDIGNVVAFEKNDSK
jgi:hypothetical protein